MSRRSLIIATVVALVGLAPGRAEPQAGDLFPPLDAFPVEGGVVPVTAGHITLVDFWASWCAPCKASFPSYAQLHGGFQAQGLVIVGVSVDEDADRFAAFVKQQAPPFPVVRDASHALVQRVKVAAMPTSFLLDRTGHVRFVHHGFHGAESVAELRHEIESLLAEPAHSR
jgi:thiol-disulfide isomerase/thioredoxin